MENCLIANFLFLMDFFQVMILADRLYLILVACKNTSFTFSPITPHNEEWFPANIHEPIPCSAESLLPKMNLTTSRSLVFQGDCSVVFSDLLSSCLCVWPWSITWLERTLALSWLQWNLTGASSEQAVSASLEQNNHSRSHVVQLPWALGEFLRDFCIPHWIWSRLASKLDNLKSFTFLQHTDP